MTRDNPAHSCDIGKPLILCNICNKPFTPKRTTSNCCSTQCRSKYKYQQQRVEVIKTCTHCGNNFARKQGQSKYCSSACRVEHIALIGKGDRELFTSIAGAHIRVSFCIVCNGFCEAPYQGKVKRFCSRNCENKNVRTKPGYRAKRARRDALKRNALVVDAVDPVFILSRDGWRCYLCGTDTPEELRGTYGSNAPEVDHVIPLSKGGLHTESNLRCSCRKCNRWKGDRILVAS